MFKNRDFRPLWTGAVASSIGLAGLSTNVFSATVSTILQLGAPGRMRGRVMSYYSIAWRGLTPLGGAIVAFLAEALGTRAVSLREAWS